MSGICRLAPSLAAPLQAKGAHATPRETHAVRYRVGTRIYTQSSSSAPPPAPHAATAGRVLAPAMPPPAPPAATPGRVLAPAMVTPHEVAAALKAPLGFLSADVTTASIPATELAISGEAA
jgi:hypothetical protein